MTTQESKASLKKKGIGMPIEHQNIIAVEIGTALYKSLRESRLSPWSAAEVARQAEKISRQILGRYIEKQG